MQRQQLPRSLDTKAVEPFGLVLDSIEIPVIARLGIS